METRQRTGPCRARFIIDKVVFINALLEFGFLHGFFNEFSRYVNSNEISISKNQQEVFDILFGNDEECYSYIKNDENFTRSLIVRSKQPLTLLTSFNSDIFEQAQLPVLIERLRMIKDDILNNETSLTTSA